MEFTDFSPPTLPTIDQQRDALQKGLGRAVQWATAGVLAADLLLEACLHDMRFDRQCEDSRGDWLWQLISITGNASKFREPLLNALQTVEDEGDAPQLCDLAVHFAKNGDEAFRNQLYEFVARRQIPDCPSIGEDDLLRLDGETAFEFVARLRGRSLLDRAWDWDDQSIVDLAMEQFGEARIGQILNRSSDSEICRFASAWLCNQKPPADRELQREARAMQIETATVSDVLRAAEAEAHCYWLISWGEQASTADVEDILQRLWNEHNPKVIINLLKVFALRPLDRFDVRFVELRRHSDRKVRFRAFNVLCENSLPEIRAFALAEMQQSSLGMPPVGLLIKNFQPGDEERILNQVHLPEDFDDRHWMFIDLNKLLEKNESADSSKLAQIAYFHNPCQMCRCAAARVLIHRGVAPAWLTEECRFDADEETRSLANEPSDKLAEHR